MLFSMVESNRKDKTKKNAHLFCHLPYCIIQKCFILYRTGLVKPGPSGSRI